jgi:hypothetical protein
LCFWLEKWISTSARRILMQWRSVFFTSWRLNGERIQK